MSEDTYEGKMPTIDDFCDPEPKEMFPGFPDFLFTKDDLDFARVRDMLECRCSHCGKTFKRCKRDVLKKHYRVNKPLIYCSQKCYNEHTILLTKDRNHHDYICKTCGKEVKKDDWYGSGMFCCERCSRSYAGKLANTPELKQKKSQKLKERYWSAVDVFFNTFNLRSQVRPQKQPPSQKSVVSMPAKKQYSQTELTNAISFLHEKWNLKDINKILCMNDKSYCAFLKANGIAENDKYVDTKRYKVIERCRIVLKKPFEDGSITVDDLKIVQDECHRLMFDEDWSAWDVCQKYLQMKSPNPKFMELCLGVKLRSVGMGVRSYLRKIGHYDNHDAEYFYRSQCSFKISSNLYKYLPGAELLKEYKWFHPINNPIGVTRDHMVSVYYGFTHNIDPYLISHPANCMIMLHNDNSSKSDRCSITVQELIERVEWFNETFLYKKTNLDLTRATKIRYTLNKDYFSSNEMNHFAMLSLI